MAQVYHKELDVTATFDLFVRSLPKNRGYLVAAGAEQAIDHLMRLRFDDEDIIYLASLGLFSDSFLERLKRFHFTGEVIGFPEGSVAFPNEPLLRVTAPLLEAQIAETALLNSIVFQTAIATKSSRVVMAARGREIVDFGLRRAQGSEAGLLASRASFIGGVSATSNLLAGKRFGIPVRGTMAHSFILAFPSEAAAFDSWLRNYSNHSFFLVDTYDTVRGTKSAIERAQEVRTELKGIRIDSGNLAGSSRIVRKILDSSGFKNAKIMLSGGLNEFRIDSLIKRGAVADSFGVGTAMVVSDDAPTLDANYKLVELEGQPKLKLSPLKQTIPGKKEVWRSEKCDIVGLDGENCSGKPMLEPMVEGGKRVVGHSLVEARQRAAEQLAVLPSRFKKLRAPSVYPVKFSRALIRLRKKLVARPA